MFLKAINKILQDVRRLDAINFCIEFLEGHEPPIFRWSPQESAHLSLVENGDAGRQEISRLIDKGQDSLDESYSDDEGAGVAKVSEKSDATTTSGGGEDLDDIRRLKHRKEELELRKKAEEEARRVRNEILSEHVSVLIEVSPKILVPDTNCFVDHLSELGRLSSVGAYKIRVPVVVLSELDGLAKGTRGHLYQVRLGKSTVAVLKSQLA